MEVAWLNLGGFKLFDLMFPVKLNLTINSKFDGTIYSLRWLKTL